MLLRRTVIAALSATALAGLAHAQAPAFPTRPVTMVVPFPAGGITDTIARALAQKMGDTLGQSVIVDNKPGGGGQIAATQVKQAAADGHTVFVGATEMFAINQNLFRKFSYDPLKDFTPISSLIASPLVLVVPANSPVNSVNDLVQQAKTRKGGMNFASQGIGSIGHLLGELFRGQTGGEYNHVAYKGSAPALQDVMAGQVDMMFDPVITTAPLIAGKKLKPLAIAAAKRSPQLPDVPTLAELGIKGVDAGVWFGAVAKAGTPEPVVAKLNDAFLKALKDPEILKRFSEQGMQPFPSSPAQFGSFMQSEVARWAPLIKASGASVD
ncbi:Bug family tripartite tricarboxylate transporter substrate binding protein [Simplicispira metamorpha]|jgi:tripartite-type tricarboxylate transporter receptor subunit TctC|uniref:Tripartite-type tricarboxylate transporter receptor subunit TctC n=1 Tax=Simplicispira metamorpha TaxID=80881 RepID=A0A4R2NC51_9BURK|nr:tripartite tricarboxylate transporter substrate binding protein [Simplicispira metamorpha]TCP18713.1 tripartite-type tricarboxylate transporter receptor subunit TctC [Simplicispira metamorpha]